MGRPANALAERASPDMKPNARGGVVERSAARGVGVVNFPSGEPEPVRRVRIPSVGSIGYTGTYREPSVDIVDVSVVSVLEARGPE
jgi:hypothetical protein